MTTRKTKIICTLGPAVDNEDMIRTLIRTGMDAARFNFSHGSHPEHLARLNMLKAVRDSMGRPVATILDTKGPEIRIRSFQTKSVSLQAGAPFTLTTEDVVGDETTLGKPVGSDAKREKTTFVTLKGLEACRELVDRLTAEAVEALACFGAEGEGLAWLAGTLAAREK